MKEQTTNSHHTRTLTPEEEDKAMGYLAQALVGDHGVDIAGDPEILRHAARIRELNDRFRESFTGGTVVVTAGIVDLGAPTQREIIAAIRAFTVFDASNDPYHEHDFGSVTIDGETIFWKIDYYDLTMTYGSEDPADPTKTTRVLTIMLASEY